MVRDHLWNRLALGIVLVLVVLVATACYKNAGENVEPTTNQVDLSDIATTPAPSTPLATPTAPAGASATPTIRLAPTITPAGFVAEPDSGEASSTPPQIAPSFTPRAATPTPGDMVITPGMSDIQPSPSPAPSLNVTLQPTPTGISVERDPCVHYVQSGDTLYSIARENEVELGDLVAANPTLLGGSELTPLQVGWELRIPGCTSGTPEPTPTQDSGAAGVSGATPAPQPSFTPAGAAAPGTHVVQAGETIYSIARQYGVTPQALIDANGLTDPNRIYPGQTLTIPPAQ